MTLLLALACTPERGPVELSLEVLEGPEPDVGPVRRLRIVASRATEVLVRLEGDDDVRELGPLEGEELEVSLVGLLPETTYTVTVEAPAGEEATAGFQTEGPPPGLPRIDVLAHDPDRTEPGLLLFSALAKDAGGAMVLVLDEALRLRWWYDASSSWSDVRVSPRGTLVALASGQMVERAWDGTLLRLHTPDPNPADPLQRPLDAGYIHHEVYPLADESFWTMVSRRVTFETYPRSYTDLEPVGPPVEVEDTPVVRIGADGAVLEERSLADVLDRGRISFDGLYDDPDEGLDWIHGNAVVPDGAGGLVVSSRNQDAVFRLDAEGALDWIVGDPLGWAPEFAEHLLAPVGELRWPYHQHGPEWHADSGTLVVFDNVDQGHTPYGPAPAEQPTSRVVAYAVDAGGGTVRQLWELEQTATGPVRSKALGDADVQPVTGNVLATYGFVQEEQGVPNEEAGRGHYSGRLVEWDLATPEAPVLDLRVWGPLDEAPAGWQIYRAERIPAF